MRMTQCQVHQDGKKLEKVMDLQSVVPQQHLEATESVQRQQLKTPDLFVVTAVAAVYAEILVAVLGYLKQENQSVNNRSQTQVVHMCFTTLT